MIKINTDNIKDWDLIKKCHEQYFEKTVSQKLKNSIQCVEWIDKEIIENKINEIDKPVLKEKIIDYLETIKTINLATGKREILKKACKEYDQFLTSLNIKTDEKKEKVVINVLKKIFNYDNFNTGRKVNLNGVKKHWSRHELLSMMDIRTCPYCNRQYITSYSDVNESNTTTADIDHFYLQSKYPILALSLYNFIPSCQICNSRMKGDDFEPEIHIYPYEEEFGADAKFRTDSSSLDFLWEEITDFEIVIEAEAGCSQEAKIKNSIEKFKLNEVYQIHKDYVEEIIKKARIYDETAIRSIVKQYPEMFKSKEEVWQCVMGNYLCEEELNKRPLSKLTKDICEEFGIEINPMK